MNIGEVTFVSFTFTSSSAIEPLVGGTDGGAAGCGGEVDSAIAADPSSNGVAVHNMLLRMRLCRMQPHAHACMYMHMLHVLTGLRFSTDPLSNRIKPLTPGRGALYNMLALSISEYKL